MNKRSVITMKKFALLEVGGGFASRLAPISRIAQCIMPLKRTLRQKITRRNTDLNQAFHMEIWNVALNEKMKMLLCNVERLSMG